MRRIEIKPRGGSAPFRPASMEDVFAVYLARELGDSSRVRWYAKLTSQYSLCILLNALRRVRKRRSEQVDPEGFHSALRDLLAEGEVL